LAREAEGALRGTGFRGTAPFGPGSFTVEFEEEFDDWRTGGKVEDDVWLFSLARPSVGGLLRVGLGWRVRTAASLVATTAGEYDEAELGVGAWLKGESVKCVKGVMD